MKLCYNSHSMFKNVEVMTSSSQRESFRNGSIPRDSIRKRSISLAQKPPVVEGAGEKNNGQAVCDRYRVTGKIDVLNTLLENITAPGQIPAREEIEKITDSSEIVGNGREKIVIDAPTDPTKVIVLPYVETFQNDSITAKKRFYASKVLSTLFPHNFPAITSSSGRIDTESSGKLLDVQNGGYVMEKIFPPENPTQQPEFPMEEVYQFYERVGLPIVIDWNGCNFIPGKDGGVYFIDEIASRELSGISVDAIVDWMGEHAVSDKKTGKEREYTAEEEALVVRSLRRLKTLHTTNVTSR